MKLGRLAFACLIGLGISGLGLAPVAAQSQLGTEVVNTTAISGVIAPGAKWTLAWSGLYNADGIVGTPDGGLLFAQEQTSTVQKLDGHEHVSVYLRNADGVGSLSVGPHGELYGDERTCTDPGIQLFEKTCTDPTKVVRFTPTRKVLADHFADGKPLGRLNDLIADSKGGVYFNSVDPGIFYINPAGKVSVVAEGVHPNGIMLSRDEKILYITNYPNGYAGKPDQVLAFDVQPDGSLTNKRIFASFDDRSADGMAIDNDGRLYVPAYTGIRVFSPDGKLLGKIDAPPSPLSLAFSGPDKKTLYAVCHGAAGPDGKAYDTPKDVRNTAMSIYKISLAAQGFKGRVK